MRHGIAAVACVLLLAGCASPVEHAATRAPGSQAEGTAAATEAEPTAVAQSSTDPRNEVRCIDAAMTGSRIRQRVCLTEAEWERWRYDSQELLRELQGPKTQAR